MFFKKPIFISLSPNVEKDDIALSFKVLFKPFKWKEGKAIKLLEQKFQDFLGIKNVFSFNSGRIAFLAILKNLDLEKNDEVLIQAFTCNAAVNPIHWAGLKPVFVDMQKESLNMNPKDLERKITSRSKIVLVQHTFGKPANLEAILEICRQHNLILVEDCAHSLGGKYKGKKLGTFGRASFFSLGRDKIISSVYGGITVTKDEELAKRIASFREELKFPSLLWIKKQLLHPILTKLIIIPLYSFFGLGKYKLVALQRLGILSKAVHKIEKEGKMPKYLFKKMPNALAILGLHQFNKLKKFNKHRYEIAKIYNPNTEDRIYMRFPVFVENSNIVLQRFKKESIYLDDGWRKTVVIPVKTDLEKMGYKKGSCPQAEKIADKILNLPTHINISVRDAQKIKDLL
jgi:perosamine synthetase